MEVVEMTVYTLKLTANATEKCHIVLQAWITSSTAQGGGGSFKNRKRIGEIDCCE